MNELIFSCKSFAELTLSELYAILKLRQEVFIVEQTCYYLDADGIDQIGWHVMGLNSEGALQAYARILPMGVSYPDYGSIGRIATSINARGTGAGKKLLERSLHFYYTFIGDYPLKISAQSHLIGFYNKFGFQSTGEAYLEDGIPHTGMVHKAPVDQD